MIKDICPFVKNAQNNLIGVDKTLHTTTATTNKKWYNNLCQVKRRIFIDCMIFACVYFFIIV